METWTNTAINPPFFWLRDGLARDNPRLRILSFGYTTRSPGTTGGLYTLEDNAKQLHHLLAEVSRGRQFPHRPGCYLELLPTQRPGAGYPRVENLESHRLHRIQRRRVHSKGGKSQLTGRSPWTPSHTAAGPRPQRPLSCTGCAQTHRRSYILW